MTTPSDRSADDVLTEFENKTQGFIHELRQMKNGTPVSTDSMAPIVSHLELRSMFLRQELSRLSDRLFDGIQKIFSTQARTEALLAKYLEGNPELIEKEFDKLNLQGSERNLASAYVASAVPSLIKETAPKLARMVHSVFSTDILQTTKLVKESHIKSIVRGFTEIERTDAHKEFEFSVIKEADDLILPDTGLAFLKPKGMSPISQKGDGIHEVIIPIDKRTYVYGYKKSPQERDSNTVNKILASCTFESFISQENSPSFSSLTKFIGKHAKMVSDAELDRMLSFKTFIEDL